MKLENPDNARALTVQGKITKARLSQNQYTISLLNEGIRVGMLNSEDVYEIQSQLMLILKKLIGRYTQGESSSVTSETAESILTSILYAVDAFMLQFTDPEKAVTYLKTVNVKGIYEKGVELVRQCLNETKQLYKEINSNKLDVGVDAYNMTIDESIPVFLKKYGIIFDAHNTMASIDYPLALDNIGIQGVFYIREYLVRLKKETLFCRFFNQEDLQKTLVNFGKTCGLDYRIELFNIFELMFNNAVFSVLSGGRANQVRISTSQYKQLVCLFARFDERQIHSVIYKAIDQLQEDLNLSDPRMIDYMNQCGRQLAQRVVKAAEHNNLQMVIIMEKEEKLKPIVTSFEEVDRMSDGRFRLLIEKIMACQKIGDKIDVIKSNFNSLQDYVDMLNANCLFDNEFEALFKTFGDIELAILAKMVFYEELRHHDSVDLLAAVAREKDPETEWQLYFIGFIKNISTERMSSIKKYIHDIDYEEIKFY